MQNQVFIKKTIHLVTLFSLLWVVTFNHFIISDKNVPLNHSTTQSITSPCSQTIVKISAKYCQEFSQKLQAIFAKDFSIYWLGLGMFAFLYLHIRYQLLSIFLIFKPPKTI